MGCLTIKAEVSKGVSVNEACTEAQDLADKIGQPVCFKFNHVNCCADPGGKAETLIKSFYDVYASTVDHKFAFSK